MSLLLGSTVGISIPRGGGTPFSPTDLSDLELWVRADQCYTDTDGTTLAVDDGDAIAYAKDLSGNGEHILQPTVSHRPTLQTLALARKSVLRLDGSDDHLGHESMSIEQSHGQVFYCVGDTTNIGTGNRLGFASLVDCDFYFGTSDGSDYAPAVMWDGVKAEWPAAVQEAAVFRWRIDSNETGVRVNNGTEITATGGTALNPWISFGFYVQTLSIDVAEFLLVGSLAAGEDALIMSYLNSRYQIY